MWTVETWDEGLGFDLRRETTISLMNALGHTVIDVHRDITAYVGFVVLRHLILNFFFPSPKALLQSLCGGNPGLESAFGMLHQLATTTASSVSLNQQMNSSSEVSNAVSGAQTWQSDDMDVMDQRLNILLSANSPSVLKDLHLAPEAPVTGSEATIPGWKYIDGNTDWKPCPIGMHYNTATFT